MKSANVYKLDYFLEWRPYLWMPVVKWLIQDPARFEGKRVLDLGCRSGKMSCYFGLLGAYVTGIDLSYVDMTNAKNEANKWNLQKVVNFRNYDGNPRSIEQNEYDFVFTKSVLIIIPDLYEFLTGLTESMKIGGELISAENVQTNSFINKVISRCTGSKVRQESYFNGVNSSFLRTVQEVFGVMSNK